MVSTRIFARQIGLFIMVLGLVLIVGSVSAQQTWEPVFNPTLQTSKTTGAVKIDGSLSDPGWRGAGHVTKFHERQPGENTKPAVRTEAFITYDDDNLYVALVCFDDPNELRATMSQRDQFFANDVAGVLIDTYGEAAWGYEFFVNPYGVQNDKLFTVTAGEDSGYDLIWESAAQITDSGYQVEMAIPFASMRFPSMENQAWRVEFWRNRPRETFYQYSWGANDRNEQCFICKWGTVTGISNVEPGKGVEILPTVVADQFGSRSSDSRFENEDADAEFSLGGKYGISSNMTVEAYYNPDFSQIEADAAQIDVNSTINLLFPERRPFFQEGADLFRTPFNSFSTRTVYDPQYAAKFTGRMSQYSFAFVTAQDERSPYTIPLEEGDVLEDVGRSWVNVLRGQRTFTNGAQVGFMATDRRFEGGGSGTILSVDSRIRLSRTLSVVAQMVGAHTNEPDRAAEYVDSVDNRPRFDNGNYTVPLDGEKFYGHAFITELRRIGRSLVFVWDYNEVSPRYRTQTGYDPWNDQRNTFVNAQYRFYPSGTIFERITPSANIDARWNFDGVRKWRHGSVGLNTNLRVAQTFIGVRMQRGEELWDGTEYNKVRSANLDVSSRPLDIVGMGLSLGVGRGPALSVDLPGNEKSVSLDADIKPIDRLMIEPSIRHIKSVDVNDGTQLFRQFIGRTRFQFQLNRRLSVRLVVQYNDLRLKYRPGYAEDWDATDLPVYSSKRWDVDPLITYRLSPFSVFYIGSTHDYGDLNQDPLSGADWKLTDRRFFLKLQYLFQV